MDQKNDNTLLWLAVLGLGAWIWYIQNNQPVYFAAGRMCTPVPLSSLNPAQQQQYALMLAATQPGGALDQNAGTSASSSSASANSTAQTTQPVTGTPVTITQTSINGVYSRNGRLGNLARP
jgi:hypothetical protein